MEALFDFSFTKFFAPKVVGIVYGIQMFFIGLFSLGLIVGGFNNGFFPGVGSLIVAPMVFLLLIAINRIFLEGFIALIRVAETSIFISQNTKLTAENTNRIP